MPNIFRDLSWGTRYSSNKKAVLPHLNESLVVNWGKGRLRKFQTKESFYAEFCLINKLTVKECIHFWHTNLNLTKLGYFSSEDQVRRVADILHEDADVVESVFAKDNYIRYFFGHHTSIDRRFHPYDFRLIRYCKSCLQVGYHSYFHDYQIFSVCLIHNEPIIVDTFRWNCSPSQYQYYINYLSNLLLINTNGNILYKKTDTTDNYNNACIKFDDFVIWTRNAAERTKSMVAVNPIAHIYIHETPQDLFGKLQSLEPSDSILDLCQKNFIIRKEKPQVIKFSQALVNDLHAITDILPYKKLIQFYLLFCLFDKDKHAFEVLAQEIITAIEDHHNCCTCGVGWTKQTGWLKFKEPVNGYQDYLCPFHYACMLIRSNWLSTDEMKNYFIWDRRFQTKRYYKQAISALAEANWITVTDSRNRKFPQITFNWSFQLTFFLETIIYASMDIFAESLVLWLTESVQTGCLNIDIQFLPPNAYLKKLEDSDDVELYVWSTTRN